jgi:ribosome biogenesis GTPase
MAKKKKIRVELRKNRSKPPRKRDYTRSFEAEEGFTDEAGQERVRAKGDLSRKRTIIQDDGTDEAEMPSVDKSTCLPGRVLRVHGLESVVQTEDGGLYRCAVRRLLKTLATDERSIVATGDRVWIRLASGDEGVIERVEPRHGVLTRASRKREHVLVANVDQVVIVMSLVEPELKPHLIDRYLASAEQGGIRPIICLNKADLVDPVAYQPLVGFYSQLGVTTLLTSAVSGMGVERLARLLKGKATAFSGQSGVGKSSLLNAIQPGLDLRVREVSDTTQKGKHTTTFAQLLQLDLGGWVVDTPGIRQFELWDIIPEEVEGFFPEFRPYVPLCTFPDCTHTHEERCAVKAAVARRQISERRYVSYLGLFANGE